MMPPTAAKSGSIHLLYRFCLLRILLVGILLCNTVTVPLINAKRFKVSPDGLTGYALSEALSLAGPGDTVYLNDGTYDEPLVTVGGGSQGDPLKIVGERAAVISGELDGR